MSEILKIVSDLGVSDKNQKEIVKAIKDIENRIPVWQEMAAIIIDGIEDTDSMKVAKDDRNVIVKERTSALKFVAEKRKVVQEEMSEFTKTDKAWLKIGQYIEEEAKSVEAILKEKEETLKVYQEEQAQKLYDERLAKLILVTPNAEQYDLKHMSEETFTEILEAQTYLKKKKEDEIAAAEKEAEEKRVREENQAKIQKERFNLTLPHIAFAEGTDTSVLWQLDEKHFNEFLISVKGKFDEKVASDKVLQDTLMARVVELTAFTFNSNKLVTIDTTEENYQIILEQAKVEYKARQNTKPVEEVKAAIAVPAKPIEVMPAPTTKANILDYWLTQFNVPTIAEDVLTTTEQEKYKNIIEKFEGFKSWAKKEITIKK